MNKQDTNTGRNIQPRDNWCWYYLHKNGDLIHKSHHADPSDFEVSDFVTKYWRVNLSDRMDAYTFLIAAMIFGAKKERVVELVGKWCITDHDCEHYLERVGLTCEIDGNAYCVHQKEGFTNIQDCVAGFSCQSIFFAIVDFCMNAIHEKSE